jgi:segregation and condensation protein B
LSALVHQLEALLFVADQPITSLTLAETLGADRAEVETGLRQLGEILQNGSALQLVNIAGGYQIATKAQFADIVAHFLKPQKQRLSKSLMEVLAIVAYQQPITIAEIEAIRGVQCDYGVRTLQERRLIREVGRRQTPGRPVLYGTSQQFLHHFNLKDLVDLPELTIARPQPVLDFNPAPPDPEPDDVSDR